MGIMFSCFIPRWRTETYEKDDDDLISELPDCLVTDILSRLPTKYAVRTSALSRNWKYKWTSIYNIDISVDTFKLFSENNGFVNFANALTRTLLQTRSSRLRSFHLSFPRVEHSNYGHFKTWVSYVLMRNVQYLELTACHIKGPDAASCFSGWNLLTGLKLEMCCTLIVPDNNCFPNLKWLWLAGDMFLSDRIRLITTKVLDTGMGDRVTLVFPVLEVLHLSCCRWLDVKYVEIQAPELISAHIKLDVTNPVFEIHGPKLAVIDLSSTPAEKIVLCPPAVTRMAVSTHEVGGFGNLFKKCPYLKFLYVPSTFLRDLLEKKLRLDFSSLDQVKELETDLVSNNDNVLESLQMFPHLESLTIDIWILMRSKFGKASTPKILSQLKEVKLVRYYESKAKYAFVKYMLQNTKNLEEMTIDISDPYRVKATHKSLSKLKPKGSKCKLVVESKGARCGSRTRVAYPMSIGCDF